MVDPNTPVGDRRLKQELDDQIRPAQCVVVIAGMYAAYRKWIQYEIDKAQEWGKPIIGLRPWGAERIPQEVVNAADEMVYWNTSSIVDAIRRRSL